MNTWSGLVVGEFAVKRITSKLFDQKEGAYV